MSQPINPNLYPTAQQLQLIEQAYGSATNLSNAIQSGTISQESETFNALSNNLNALMQTSIPPQIKQDFQNLLSTTPANLNQNLTTVTKDLNNLWTTPPTTTTWIGSFQNAANMLYQGNIPAAQSYLHQVIQEENDPHSYPTKQAEAYLAMLSHGPMETREMAQMAGALIGATQPFLPSPIRPSKPQ